MRRLAFLALLGSSFALLLVGLTTESAYAHGFGQRYDLPVPLWMYLTGAGVAVALSFVVIGFFMRRTPGLHGYAKADLLRWRAGRLVVHPAVVWPLKALSLGIFGLVVVAGLFGSQEPLENLAPTMVWVIWWVGMAYASAFIGNVWAVLNPWGTLFDGADVIYRRLNPGDALASDRPYPERLGYWPAVALFLLFAWVEIVYPSSAEPRGIATMVITYTFITLAGMVMFGKYQWLKYGEAFSVAFGLLAKFSPTEVAVTDPDTCSSCSSGCDVSLGGCVNCYECFRDAGIEDKELRLRPFGAGLLQPQVAWPSLLAFVVLMLSTVTYDGFTATSLWADIVGTLLPLFEPLGAQTVAGIKTVGILAFPLIFLMVYTGFSIVMAAFVGRTDSWGAFARTFVFSLIPIALAYHLAHFLSFLLIQGQLVIPLLSDPLGLGWDLLGTAGYKINIAIVNAKFAWITSVTAIVLGHIVAVYVAHVVAVRMLPKRGAAIKSQYPMLVLMVGYTMVSLWIIAQPIVQEVR